MMSVPPPGADILAIGPTGEALAWQAGQAFGFAFHPGAKFGMVEDLVMEFDETPPDIPQALAALAAAQGAIAEALGPFMVGLVAATGLMAA